MQRLDAELHGDGVHHRDENDHCGQPLQDRAEDQEDEVAEEEKEPGRGGNRGHQAGHHLRDSFHRHHPGEGGGRADEQHAHGGVDGAGQDDPGEVLHLDPPVDDHPDEGGVEHGDHGRLGDGVVLRAVGEDPAAVVKEAKALGLPYAGCAWIPHEGSFDEAACRRAAAVFNNAGKVAAAQGIKFYYHNHGYEFVPRGRARSSTCSVQETKPEWVIFQMDVFWTVHPGQDPVKLLRRYPNRWELVSHQGPEEGCGDGQADRLGGRPQRRGPGHRPDRSAQDSSNCAGLLGVKHYFIEDESPMPRLRSRRACASSNSLSWCRRDMRVKMRIGHLRVRLVWCVVGPRLAAGPVRDSPNPGTSSGSSPSITASPEAPIFRMDPNCPARRTRRSTWRQAAPGAQEVSSSTWTRPSARK